jgi:hypothetical protein
VVALWIVLGLLALAGAVALARSLRSVRAEITPTIDAFADLRAALAPATVAVRDDRARLQARLDAREAGRQQHQG